jgi:hypothetical protein
VTRVGFFDGFLCELIEIELDWVVGDMRVVMRRECSVEKNVGVGEEGLEFIEKKKETEDE